MPPALLTETRKKVFSPKDRAMYESILQGNKPLTETGPLKPTGTSSLFYTLVSADLKLGSRRLQRIQQSDISGPAYPNIAFALWQVPKIGLEGFLYSTTYLWVKGAAVIVEMNISLLIRVLPLVTL